MNTNDDDGRMATDLAPVPAHTEAHDPERFMPPGDARRPEGEDAVFSHDDVNQLRPMWSAIQTRFVDEPRQSVQEADVLVASTIQRLAKSFAEEKAKLESQWAQGADVSTEDLRLALRRYRAFFNRLLSA